MSGIASIFVATRIAVPSAPTLAIIGTALACDAAGRVTEQFTYPAAGAVSERRTGELAGPGSN
ncbi:MAG: hypothetical protein ABIK82_00935 [Pseudomonadota bacterium]